MALTVSKSTMTGSEVEYTIPLGTKHIYFRPPAADVTIATTTGGSTWTLTATEVYNNNFAVNEFESQTIFMTGTNSQIVQIMLES